MLKVSGGHLGRVPVLVCPLGTDGPKINRVSYAAINQQKGVCYFPAYPPFLAPILEDLKKVFGDVEFSDKAKERIAEGEKMAELQKQKFLDPAFKFKTLPFAHQIDSLLYAIYNPRCGLLLDCGLGKTKVAIDLVNYLKIKTLVLCPPSLVNNWVEEIKTHSSLPLKILALNDKSAKLKKGKLAGPIDADIMLVGYETAALYYEEIFKNFDYEMIVADEIHKAKNPKSKRTKAALALSQKAHRRIGMSGTMVLGKPTDLYSQLKFLSPQILNQDYYSFCMSYVVYSPYNKHIPVGVKQLDVLNAKVKKHTLRYKKEDCLDLPVRHVIDKVVDLSPEQWAMYKDIVSDKDLYIDEGVISKEFKMVTFAKLGQLTGGFLYVSTKNLKLCHGCHNVVNCVDNGIKPYTKMCSVEQISPPSNVRRFKVNPKLDLTMELLDEILVDPENKVIIWAQALEELKMLEETLTAAKISYVRVADDPVNDIRPFNEDPSVQVMISNISKGVGFTANAANYTIYYSLSYSLEAWQQSVDRNYRIGQKRPVTVYRLLARGTVDHRVVEAIDSKVDIVEALLNNVDCIKCDQMLVCAPKNIQMWGKGCRYERKKNIR